MTVAVAPAGQRSGSRGQQRPGRIHRDGADALGPRSTPTHTASTDLRFSLSSSSRTGSVRRTGASRTVRRRLWPPDAALATMSAMDVSSAAVGLPVSDLAAAVTWYRQVLELAEPDLQPADGVVEFKIRLAAATARRGTHGPVRSPGRRPLRGRRRRTRAATTGAAGRLRRPSGARARSRELLRFPRPGRQRAEPVLGDHVAGICAARRRARRLTTYGCANMYRPVNRRRASGAEERRTPR